MQLDGPGDGATQQQDNTNEKSVLVHTFSERRKGRRMCYIPGASISINLFGKPES